MNIEIIETEVKNINLDDIEDNDLSTVCLRIVSAIFNVSIDNIKSKNRRRKYVDARYAYIHMMRYALGSKSTLIAKTIDKHHSTIIYAFRLLESFKISDKRWEELYNKCILLLNQYCNEKGLNIIKENNYIKYQAYRKIE